jgi:UDP-N-acetylmuramate dehydrogenase
MELTIRENIDLKPFNTFGIKANARHFATLSSVDDLMTLIHTPLFNRERHLILGGGSNILLTKDFEGLVIHNNLKGIEILQEDDTHITLRVASGEEWHSFVMYCVNNNWGGIENLALIPGTSGAAPMQNIGAYGVEIKDVVNFVTGIDLKTGAGRTLSNTECLFGYRESVFKHELKENFFISSVTLTLTKKDHALRMEYGAIKDTLMQMNVECPTIQSIAEAVIKIRQQKLPDPHVLGNSGSFFKNPTIPLEHYTLLKQTHPDLPGYPTDIQMIKIPAAWLIQRSGWKGKRLNHAGVHDQQALVLINYDSATGREILDLAKMIQQDVYDKFTIHLTPEVNII